MRTFFALGTILAALAASADPSVTVNAVTQNAANGEVEVVYTLANAPAIVTVDICTNGVLLGEDAYGSVAGDIHKLMEADGTYRFRWRPDLEDRAVLMNADVEFKVDAWLTTDPPDYMVVNLAEANAVWYFASTNAFPGGLLRNPLYRTDAVVMRYIHAKGKTAQLGAWNVANNKSLENGAESSEPQFSATFDHDFWIGVFEVTQAQSELVRGTTNGGSWNSANSNVLYRAMRPAEMISYNDVRDKNNSANFYPRDPHASSWLGLARTKTGLKFDLPCDAQWEYACRAGTTPGYWNDGSRMLPEGTPLSYYKYECPDVVIPGRWACNGGQKSWKQKSGQDAHDFTSWSDEEMMQMTPDECRTATCGSYAPNAWGLYDMHGNVFEYVNDFAPANGSTWATLGATPNVNPTDPTKQYDGSAPTHPSWADSQSKYYNRVMRSGEFSRGASACRSAARGSQPVANSFGCNGFRLIINVAP